MKRPAEELPLSHAHLPWATGRVAGDAPATRPISGWAGRPALQRVSRVVRDGRSAGLAAQHRHTRVHLPAVSEWAPAPDPPPAKPDGRSQRSQCSQSHLRNAAQQGRLSPGFIANEPRSCGHTPRNRAPQTALVRPGAGLTLRSCKGVETCRLGKCLSSPQTRRLETGSVRWMEPPGSATSRQVRPC
jgi:hypothetical protein